MSPQEIGSIRRTLDERVAPHLTPEAISRALRGRMQLWLPYRPPTTPDQPFPPSAPVVPEVWSWIVAECAKHGFVAEVAVVSRGGDVKEHRDYGYAARWAMGINLGTCNWRFNDVYAEGDAPDWHEYELTGGEVFKFACQHVHAVTGIAPDRWGINVWPRW